MLIGHTHMTADWCHSLTWASMRAADSAPSWSCILIGHILSPEPRCVRLTPPPAGPWVAAPERWPPASAAAAGPAVAVVTASDDGRWAAAVRCVGTSPRAWPARTWASWSCPRQRCRRQAAKHKHADRLLIIRNICFVFLLDSFLCRQRKMLKEERILLPRTWFLKDIQAEKQNQTYVLYPFNVAPFSFFSRQCEMLSDN